MRRKLFFYMSLYLAFMVGYFLLLAIVLPSSVPMEPSWIKEGSFAEYSIEDSGFGNGTYAWKIIAVEKSNGKTIVTVNETLHGSSHWSHIDTIPLGGKTTKITASEGTIEDQILWLGTYYNSFLVDRTVFVRENCTYDGDGLEKTSFQGTERDAIRVYPGFSTASARFDKASGIFLWYSFSSKLGHFTVSLNFTNIFDHVNVADENIKTATDYLLVAPLFVLPVAGALIGLNSIRKRDVCLSVNFWKIFVFLNGLLIALLSNFPMARPYGILYYSWAPIVLFVMIAVNVVFWSGLFFAAVFIINRFAFPIVKRNDVALEE